MKEAQEQRPMFSHLKRISMKQRLLICLMFVLFQPVWSTACVFGFHSWSMAVMQKGDKSPTFLTYTAEEDTTVNGFAYFCIVDNNQIPGERPSQLPYGYRMANKKIYIYDFDSHEETVGFDFNLSVGDHFATYNGMQWEVLSAKDTLVNVSECGLGECVSKRLLSVQTLDGTMTDLWLEDFGSFANHFMIKSMETVVLSQTLWMDYGRGCYLAREISADPFYAHVSKWIENDEEEDCSVGMYDVFSQYSYENGNLLLENDVMAYGHRFYSCFYRDGDDLYRVNFFEMGPDLECPLSLKKDTFMFVGVPSPTSGKYTLHVDNDTYSTGVRPVVSSSKAPHCIYDAQGRQLPAKPRRGLYIQDGVKCIAK